MLTDAGNYNYQNDVTVNGTIYGDIHDDAAGVFASCRHYSPAGGAEIIDMENYTMCDSCRHKRMDERCGIAEKTLM